ncbi:MAG: FtsQ-type POTRA domain-containing protein, partial [Oscillospiraceae bacterium]|nr:FtsQ-type POTRA domain-containing protein [Oscillospiraceae bacterium]
MKFRILKKEKKQTENRFVDNAKKKQRKARKRRKITPFLIVVSLFILAAAVYLCLTMLFNVDRIIIEGNTLYEERELIETSGIEKGENLFEVDTAYAENKLYSVFNYVEAVEVKRSFPNAVTITITEAEPFSVIEEADGYTLVSAGGKVLERGLEEVPYGLLSVRGLSTITSTEDDVKRMDLMQSIINSMKKL